MLYFLCKEKKPLSPAYLHVDGVNVVLKQVYIHVLKIQVPVI